MNKLVSVNFFPGEQHFACGMAETGSNCSAMNCCKNVHHFVHLKKDYPQPAITAHVPYFPLLLGSLLIPVDTTIQKLQPTITSKTINRSSLTTTNQERRLVLLQTLIL